MKVDPIVYLRIHETGFIIPRSGELFTIEKFKTLNAEYSVFKNDQTSVDTLLNIVSKTFLKDFKKPFIVMADSFGIPQFSFLKFDPEIVKILNQQGLHIFLHEPLVKYTGKRRIVDRTNLTPNFLKEFTLTDIRFEMTEYAKETLKSFQLDCVNDLLLNNNLTDVSVYTPDFNAKTFFAQSYPNIKLYCQDLFLSESISEICALEESAPTDITYRFACSNWRYAPHRHLVMAYLIHYSGKYSWHFRGTFEQLNNQLWFDLTKWDTDLFKKISEGLDILNSQVPLNIDIDIPNATDIEGHLGDWLLLPSYDLKPYYTTPKVYENVFCAVVNEGDVADPTSNISEKTLMAIKHRRPFILAGQHGSLDYAKKLGFKTFNDFWDESYDTEVNHERRLQRVLKTLDYVSSIPQSELEEIYKKMEAIIDHNYQNLKALASSKDWPKF
jgi:hypothetical protein